MISSYYRAGDYSGANSNPYLANSSQGYGNAPSAPSSASNFAPGSQLRAIGNYPGWTLQHTVGNFGVYSQNPAVKKPVVAQAQAPQPATVTTPSIQPYVPPAPSGPFASNFSQLFSPQQSQQQNSNPWMYF